uniref:Uncharacterized protein n=1 Tax=Arundo donax TaxID=35708 RepID=A0A0A9HPD3_ARUDO
MTGQRCGVGALLGRLDEGQKVQRWLTTVPRLRWPSSTATTTGPWSRAGAALGFLRGNRRDLVYEDRGDSAVVADGWRRRGGGERSQRTKNRGRAAMLSR